MDNLGSGLDEYSYGGRVREYVANHPFIPCGAGSKTSDGACYAVREKGGKRELCHETIMGRLCKLPKEAHSR